MQFGWEEGSRILPKETFCQQRVVGGEEWEDDGPFWKETWDDMAYYDRYWARVFPALWDMFEHLAWWELDSMSPAERVRYIRAEAEKRAAAASSA